ncbi:MAG: hypothetical protein SGARI_002722 [Bacillariaceae sp.]
MRETISFGDGKFDPLEDFMGDFLSSDDYMDANGKTIATPADLVRWLVVDVGITVQHLKYCDLKTNRYGSDIKLCISEDEFNAIQEQELSSRGNETMREIDA